MLSQGFMTIFYLLAALLLLFFAYSLFSYSRKKPEHRPKSFTKQGNPLSGATCPVCGTPLTNGEQIKSALFPGNDDRLCHIFGCPHCHPYSESGIVRQCPVCKKKLSEEGFLVARLFDRQGGKHHVHILGCTNCRLTGAKKK